jgi:hypothetical protein
VEQHRRAFCESANDILRRILPLVPLPGAGPGPGPEAGPLHGPSPTPLAGRDAPAPAPGTRSRGQWTVEIEGRRIPAANLKAAYRALLLALAERQADFLPRFAEEKGRSRRFVARTPVGLYAASPHLAKKHAEPLADGWFVDTNLSADQASRRSRIAARLCGLNYGSDVRILENLREI